MIVRLSRPLRMSFRTALVLAVAAVGLTAFTASASASFTLKTGTLKLTNGSTTGSPPSGSWVTLPTDNPLAEPPFFKNLATTWTGTPAGEYTLIDGSEAGKDLTLGAAQTSGGIFGPLTSFGATLPASTFYAFTVSGSTPSFTFTGSASGAGTRTLTAGDLTGLRISYGGNTYDVSTSAASGGNHTVPLKGTITGDATKAKKATITLDWTTNLNEPGFELYEAQFQWVGVYTP
jgi:hypothetical protein